MGFLVNLIGNMLGQILVGLLIAGVGGVVMYFSQAITDAFGRSAWAEAHLGSTRTMYVLIAFIMVIVGFLFVFGVISLSSPIETATGV